MDQRASEADKRFAQQPESIAQRSLLARAREFREKSLPKNSTETSASENSQMLHEVMYRPVIERIDQIHAFTRFLTEENAFSYPRLNDDPVRELVVDKLLAHLERIGCPIDSFPPHVEESGFAGDRVVTMRPDGRRISAAFLLHLCQAVLIDTYAPDVATILEIGAGYGSLARVLKLLKPRRQYIIVDLPDSLFCSYVYLSANFPTASTLWITEEDTSIGDQEFVFIPTQLLNIAQRRPVDLVLNAASLGEMTDAAVTRYMSLIHSEARYFYSHNRYGPRDPTCSPDLTRCSVSLDAGWDVLFWDLWGSTGFGQDEPATPPSIELLVKRRADATADPSLASAYFRLAQHYSLGSPAWHFCMWNSIRILPTKAALTAYLAELEKDPTFNEIPYYRALLATTPHVDLTLSEGLQRPVSFDKSHSGDGQRRERTWIEDIVARHSLVTAIEPEDYEVTPHVDLALPAGVVRRVSFDKFHSGDGQRTEKGWIMALATSDGFITGGPYVSIKPGDYEVTYEFDCIDIEGRDKELRLSITDSLDRELAVQSIRQFPVAKDARRVRFTVDRPGLKIEFRIAGYRFSRGKLHFTGAAYGSI